MTDSNFKVLLLGIALSGITTILIILLFVSRSTAGPESEWKLVPEATTGEYHFYRMKVDGGYIWWCRGDPGGPAITFVPDLVADIAPERS
mgnify:CR=1 FL=1